MIVLGYFVGLGLFAGELYAMMILAEVALGLAPGSVLLEYLKKADRIALAFFTVFIILFAFLMPRVMRLALDRRWATMTRDRRVKQRRMRRNTTRLAVVMTLMIVAAPTAAAVFGPWQIAATLSAKIAVTSGSAILGFSIFGRRGSRLVCARCDYPMSTWLGAPGQAPSAGIIGGIPGGHGSARAACECRGFSPGSRC